MKLSSVLLATVAVVVSVLVAVATLAAEPTVVAAESADLEKRGGQDKRFLGLWEGVDPNDGSRRTISITDNDDDGELEVAARDTFWSLCDGDRGIELATGTIVDGVLVTLGTVQCFDTGVKITIEKTYELNKKQNTLLATPLGTGLVAPTLHRVSN